MSDLFLQWKLLRSPRSPGPAARLRLVGPVKCLLRTGTGTRTGRVLASSLLEGGQGPSTADSFRFCTL